ncbi:VanZ family protein [Guptibacillus hwajinpoensis]|uniref:VanZ-like domain-containing protein n=1 Tax=Guptibacillus hwajinpoensis TaxID=208199 RepID=A0A0J6CV07_9BACL|nr:VanZ family protein [Alkalihalobacillus macyae]KMM36935.1 hypothetical protein AB986_13560 [Alkalihalobacillus macyae]
MSVSMFVTVMVRCWLCLGLFLASVAMLTLVGHEPSPFLVKVFTSVVKAKEFQYGPLTLSVINNGELGLTHFIIRKLGHFFVYSFLTIFLLYLPLTKSPFFKPILVFMIVSTIAVSDEFVQAFIPGRTSLVMDVVVDLLGSLHSLILYSVWRKCYSVRLFT